MFCIYRVKKGSGFTQGRYTIWILSDNMESNKEYIMESCDTITSKRGNLCYVMTEETMHHLDMSIDSIKCGREVAILNYIKKRKKDFNKYNYYILFWDE